MSKVENGFKGAGNDLARLCDAALNAGGELARLAAVPVVPLPLTADNPAAQELVMNLSTLGQVQISTLRRRDLLAGGVASAATWMLSAPSAPVPDDPRLAEAFAAILVQLRRAAQTASPAMVAPTVATQTVALQSLAAGAGRRTRDELLVLAAHYSMFAGWLAQESDDAPAALLWTARGAELAAAAHDNELVAYSMVRRALVALYHHDALETIALAQRAQELTTSWRVRGLAAQREAQGQAIAGNDLQCGRALERAADWLERAGAVEASPVIGTSTVIDPAAMVTGWCLVELGRPAEAVHILSRECDRLPAGAVRARARFHARLALALASTREVDQACAVAEQPIDAVIASESATIRSDLRRLSQVLSRTRDSRSVRDIAPRLTAALHVPHRPVQSQP